MTAASKGATATSNEIWPAMIGQQITVRGKVALGKIGWFKQSARNLFLS